MGLLPQRCRGDWANYACKHPLLSPGLAAGKARCTDYSVHVLGSVFSFVLTHLTRSVMSTFVKLISFRLNFIKVLFVFYVFAFANRLV